MFGAAIKEHSPLSQAPGAAVPEAPPLSSRARPRPPVNHRQRAPVQDQPRPGGPAHRSTPPLSAHPPPRPAPPQCDGQSGASARAGGWGMCEHKRQEIRVVWGAVTMATCARAPPRAQSRHWPVGMPGGRLLRGAGQPSPHRAARPWASTS